MRWKLLLAFGLILILMTALIGLTFRTTFEHRGAHASVEESLQTLDLIAQASASMLRMQSEYRGYLLTGEASYLAAYDANRAIAETQLRQLELEAEAASEPAQAERWRQVQRLVSERQQQFINPGIALRQRINDGLARADELPAHMASDQDPEQIARIRDLIAATTAEEAAHLREHVGRADREGATLAGVLVVGGAALLAIGLLSVTLLVRDISDPVSRLAQTARELAEGRLDRRIGLDRGDELGQMSAAFDHMAQRLDLVVREQAQALRSLREHDAVLQAVMDSAAVGMVLITPERQVTIVNRRASELIGIDLAAYIGRHTDDLVPMAEQVFDDPTLLVSEIYKTMEDGDAAATYLAEQRWPEQRQLEISTTPVYLNPGERLGRLFTIRDVTREREIDRMKTEFVSQVSHELRTPLTSIKGYVDLLLEGEVGELADEQRGFLTIVAGSTDRLIALINDLLDISRIETGKMELTRERVDLADHIRVMATALRPQIEAKDQQLTLELPDEPLIVVGDPDRIDQILTNLLSNAQKYTPPAGQIRIVAEQQPGTVRVDVIDTGIGISLAEQEHLFTRFYRAANRVAREAGGTGLGLAITRSLVELHGGTITVRSRLGAGSTFTVTLPTAAELDPAGSPVPTGEGRRILVVEDEPDIAGLLRRFLQRAGHQVTVAATAADALRQARETRPDLITLDLQIPDVDGYTLLDLLRTDEATRNIPVIVVSVSGDEGDDERPGVVGHLTKPVEEAVLVACVRQALVANGCCTVLVAGDDNDSRRSLTMLLRRAGHRTLEAADGEEAVRLVGSSQVDLAVIDLQTAGADGLATLRTLRADPKGRDLPTIIMSAGPSMAEGSRGSVAAWGATVIEKPVAAAELVATVARLLDREEP